MLQFFKIPGRFSGVVCPKQFSGPRKLSPAAIDHGFLQRHQVAEIVKGGILGSVGQNGVPAVQDVKNGQSVCFQLPEDVLAGFLRIFGKVVPDIPTIGQLRKAAADVAFILVVVFFGRFGNRKGSFGGFRHPDAQVDAQLTAHSHGGQPALKMDDLRQIPVHKPVQRPSVLPKSRLPEGLENDSLNDIHRFRGTVFFRGRKHSITA